MGETDVGRLFTLLRRLRDGDDEAVIAAWPDSTRRLDCLLRLLRENRLSGYFRWLLANRELVERLPPAVVKELDDAYRAQAERAGEYLQLLVDLKRNFEASGIDFINLKGLYISKRFFGDISSRFMWDVDILVAPADLHRAAAEACRIGLSQRSHSTIDPADERLGIHALELKGERGKLDIHIALRNLPGIRIDLERQWRQAHNYRIDDATLPCASDEDTLFMACLGLGTDLQRGRHNLRKIWDVCIMLGQMDASTDWEAFLAQREREGALRLVLNTCALALYLSGTAPDCPQFASALQRRPGLLLIRSADEAHAIYRRGRSPLRNRCLFARLLPVPAWRYWLQTLVTAPVRRRYYRETGRKRRSTVHTTLR